MDRVTVGVEAKVGFSGGVAVGEIDVLIDCKGTVGDDVGVGSTGSQPTKSSMVKHRDTAVVMEYFDMREDTSSILAAIDFFESILFIQF